MGDINSYKDVWVYAEQRQGKITPVVLELLGEGKKIAAETGSELCAFLIGNEMNELAKELVEHGAQKVYVAESPLLELYTTDGYTKVLADGINQYKPEIVLYGATHIGRDLAPRVAARVNTGLTADCTKLDVDPEDQKLKQTRPAFGGNLMATIVCPNHRPQMSTVRPGVMEKAQKDPKNTGEVIKVDLQLEADDIRTKVVEIVKHKKEMVSLTDADFIISGGKGLGGPEGFDMLKELAEVLGGTVGPERLSMPAGLTI